MIAALELPPERLAEAVDIIRKLRAEEGLSMEGFDVVVEGDTFGGWVENVAPLADWEAAGATWWVEAGGTSSAALTGSPRCDGASPPGCPPRRGAASMKQS